MNSSTAVRPATGPSTPCPGIVKAPGGVFGQGRFQRGHIELLHGVGGVSHSLLGFGGHETTGSRKSEPNPMIRNLRLAAKAVLTAPPS
ncbi:hypothetical protein [Streptomyces sennicomposti]